MEQIRERARAGLMAAPRVGIGVGGLLLGVRDEGRIRLLDSIEIPCSHATGPSFGLTPDEKRDTRAMVVEAGEPGVAGKVGVIGWYCSKVRGEAALNDSDLRLYAELFPDPAQFALVLRPSKLDSMGAAFFFRDGNGAVVKAVECVVDAWRPVANVDLDSSVKPPKADFGAPLSAESPLAPKLVETPELPPTLRPAETPQPAEILKFRATPLTATPPQETRLSDLGGLAPSAGPGAKEPPNWPAPSSMDRAALFGVPLLTPPPRRSGKLSWALGAVAALAVGAAAFMTQDSWIPKPPLTLSSSELNGTLLIRWNPEALRGVDHASMFVNDGGQPAPTLIPLDRLQLSSGLLSYSPKSPRVTAKLDAGETTAITAWFASLPEPAIAPPTASSGPGSTIPKLQDNSQTARP